MKANGSILTLSDIVRVGIYKFDEYKILENNRLKYIVGHKHGEKPFEINRPIEPTEMGTISDRDILDSLMVLASNAPNSKDSDGLFLTWCQRYGLPFCSSSASQKVGYLACPLTPFRDFLFLLRDAFWKAESLCEDFEIEHSIDNIYIVGDNPYRKQGSHFSKEGKETLISDFVNGADLKFCFEYRNGTPTFYNYAADIMALVKYQFALVLLSNGESVPRRCKCCGSMFFANRKNKLYGPCCSRQKRYAAEKRKRAKEGGVEKRG